MSDQSLPDANSKVNTDYYNKLISLPEICRRLGKEPNASGFIKSIENPSESTESLKIYEDHAHDFSSNTHYPPIGFVMAAKECSFLDACNWIAEGAGKPKPDKGKTSKKKRKQYARIIATYPYHDESGKLLYEVCRTDPKGDFPVRRPDPKGKDGWAWDLNGIPRVLFGLPELLAADPEKPVLVVEGEKDVSGGPVSRICGHDASAGR